MPRHDRLAYLALSAALCLDMSCTTTDTTTVVVPGTPGSKLDRAPGNPPVVTGAFHVEDEAVVGQVGFAKDACVLTTTRPVETHVRTTKGPSGAGNGFWVVAGVGMGVGAVVALADAPHESNTQSCSTDSNGKQSCGSPRDQAYAAALALGIGSALAIGGAIVGFGKKEETSDQVVKVDQHASDSPKPCGDTASLAGAKVRIFDGSAALLGQVDAEGRFRIPIPPTADLSATTTYPLTLESVPETAYRLVDLGQPLGTVDLAPVLAARRRQAQERYADADRYDFTGVVHGDTEARSGFTLACTPSGTDVCFDAIDNDCDGIYDVGCGYQSGALQWTLAWKTGDDLDLHVIGPDGVHVYFRHRRGGAAGLQLDVDCLGSFGHNCLAQNVENIFTPRDRKPMPGTYRGWVEVFRAVQDRADVGRRIAAMVGGRIAGKTFRIPLLLQAQSGASVHFAFAVGADRDRDSVINAQDACPDQPGVYSDVPGENGCPDTDLDGIADRFDSCPHEPGLRDADPGTTVALDVSVTRD